MYNLSVLEHAAVPILTVLSHQSSPDSCHVTLNCTGSDVSLTTNCSRNNNTNHNMTCSQEDEEDSMLFSYRPNRFLSIYADQSRIMCNHSNPVSWSLDTIEFHSFCKDNLVNPTDPDVLLVVGIVAGASTALAAINIVLAIAVWKLKNKGHKRKQGDGPAGQDGDQPVTARGVSPTQPQLQSVAPATATLEYSTVQFTPNPSGFSKSTPAPSPAPTTTVYDTIQSSRITPNPTPPQDSLQDSPSERTLPESPTEPQLPTERVQPQESPTEPLLPTDPTLPQESPPKSLSELLPSTHQQDSPSEPQLSTERMLPEGLYAEVNKKKTATS
ncbi:mucin-2-like [Engraulis encrasicolus]|uniref:mucin-2-like n=1 Tax=Engraulis encrasicolus TaxID=184585 RepID=UPI002FD6426E